ncbi:MAG: transposase, partial [Methanobrevibacter sp.]|nr:transposase [Candidatus Methanovirga meridionalis]
MSKLYKYKGTFKTFNGYLLIAGDATKVVLPNIKPLREIYGGKKCDDGILRSTGANVSMLYNCLNHFIFDLAIDKYKTNEKTLIFRNIKNIANISFLKDKTKIFIFDRGYPSLEFFYTLLCEGNIKFVFRLPKSMYKKEREAMDTKDGFIDIILSSYSIGSSKASEKIKNEFRKLGKINLRITTVLLENGEE